MAIGARIRRVLANFQLAALMFYYEAMTVGLKNKKKNYRSGPVQERERKGSSDAFDMCTGSIFQEVGGATII
jgi:hypothetical protein